MADWTDNAEQIMSQQRTNAAGYVLWSTFLSALAAGVIAPVLLADAGPVLARGASFVALAVGIACSLLSWSYDQVDAYPYQWLDHKEQDVAEDARALFRRTMLVQVIADNDHYIDRLRLLATIQVVALAAGFIACLGWIYR